MLDTKNGQQIAYLIKFQRESNMKYKIKQSILLLYINELVNYMTQIDSYNILIFNFKYV